MKVVFACPTVDRPHDAFLKAMEDSVPLLDAAGLDHKIVFERGNPYISAARANMLRKALDTDPDAIVFLDHDVSWSPKDLLKLIETNGDVVAGTYRFKKDEEEYMGSLMVDNQDIPQGRKSDGALSAHRIPAGFLKISKPGVNKFMAEYPDLVYGPYFNPSVDLFNHGAHGRLWYGEDYAFCRRWLALNEPIWVVPDMDIDHHSADKVYRGNLHRHLSANCLFVRRDNGTPSWSRI